jgi:hypothetical protein
MFKRRLFTVGASAALAASMIIMSSASALADGGGNSHAIYNSIPSPLPGNLASVGGEAYAFNEFGNAVTFSPGSPRDLSTVVVTMSSWGCFTGHWNSGDCATPRGATFSEPITLNIYQPSTDALNPGALIATVTKSFSIPYRPSASTNCTGGTWYNKSDSTCYNGLATNITFDFSSHITLPDGVVYGIAYNTTHYGYAPIGEAATCYTSSGGCGYDSLNIALSQDPTDVSVGSDPNPGTVFQNSPLGSEYCDGGLAGTGRFRLDSPTSACWGVNAPYTSAPWYVPAVQFNVRESTNGHDGGHGGHGGDGHPGHGGGHDGH